MKKQYTTVVKSPQLAGNPHPHLMGWWYTTLIYDSPEKDWQIGEKKVYKPLKEPKRVKTWSHSKIEFLFSFNNSLSAPYFIAGMV